MTTLGRIGTILRGQLREPLRSGDLCKCRWADSEPRSFTVNVPPIVYMYIPVFILHVHVMGRYVAIYIANETHTCSIQYMYIPVLLILHTCTCMCICTYMYMYVHMNMAHVHVHVHTHM